MSQGKTAGTNPNNPSSPNSGYAPSSMANSSFGTMGNSYGDVGQDGTNAMNSVQRNPMYQNRSNPMQAALPMNAAGPVAPVVGYNPQQEGQYSGQGQYGFNPNQSGAPIGPQTEQTATNNPGYASQFKVSL